jgi:hypothetical protein
MLGRDKKRAVQVSLVRTDDKKSTTNEDKYLRPETVKLIAERSKEVIKYAALTAVGAYAAIKTIDTLSQIAVKKTKSADNEEK